TRLLIDHLHETGACPKLQIAVGGGVFNRAEGLAEEIDADIWATDPSEMVEMLSENPDQRMGEDQRTVGRKRRQPKALRIAEAALVGQLQPPRITPPPTPDPRPGFFIQ